MKIDTVNNSHMRNDEHFQFHTEVKDLIDKAGANSLKIELLYGDYAARYADEDEANRIIAKSAITADIKAEDKKRDGIYRGLVDTVNGALNHYDPEISAAAKRIKVVLDTFGNVGIKPINEETAAIYNLLQELNEMRKSDVQTTGLQGWLDKLGEENIALENLVKERNDETAAKTHLREKNTRAATDRVYAAITERINALIIVEGEAAYSDFVNKLNSFIDKYNRAIAQRAGRRNASKKTEGENTEAEKQLNNEI